MDTRNKILAFSFLFLIPVLTVSTHFSNPMDELTSTSSLAWKGYKWQQILPYGNGSHQDEWKPGTYPMGIAPMLAFDGKLWMTGQKFSWSSLDGKSWVQHAKKDWGERITISRVFFNNRLWSMGGMQYQERQLLNEIWFSKDGMQWEKSGNGSWEPRKGFALVPFKNRLWLFAGVTKASRDFESLEMKNDIWSTADGVQWTREVEHAPWSPRDSPHAVVLRDTLYLIGGQGRADVWRSVDGKKWTQQTRVADWGERFDQGVAVFDDKLWIFGGRDTLSNHNLAAQNDVWSSVDGAKWNMQEKHAPWSVRSGVNSLVFKDQLWLYSGKHTGGNPVWKGDIWAMTKAN